MRLTCSRLFLTIFILVYFLQVEYSILRCFEYRFCQINWLKFFPSFLPLFFALRRKPKGNITKNILLFVYTIIRNSRTVVLCKKRILKKLAKFNEVADLQHATLSKRNSAIVDFMRTLRNFSEQFFCRSPSDNYFCINANFIYCSTTIFRLVANDDVTYVFQLSTFST